MVSELDKLLESQKGHIDHITKLLRQKSALEEEIANLSRIYDNDRVRYNDDLKTWRATSETLTKQLHRAESIAQQKAKDTEQHLERMLQEIAKNKALEEERDRLITESSERAKEIAQLKEEIQVRDTKIADQAKKMEDVQINCDIAVLELDGVRAQAEIDAWEKSVACLRHIWTHLPPGTDYSFMPAAYLEEIERFKEKPPAGPLGGEEPVHVEVPTAGTSQVEEPKASETLKGEEPAVNLEAISSDDNALA